MRTIACLLLIVGIAFAHGGSQRSPGSGGITVVPHGGDPDEPPLSGPKGPASSTPGASYTNSTWDVWWAQNMEYILAKRRLGVTVTRTRPTRREESNSQMRRFVEVVL